MPDTTPLVEHLGRSYVVSSLTAFVVVSMLAFLLALLLFDGIIWPAVVGVFCGFAAAPEQAGPDGRRGRRRRPR